MTDSLYFVGNATTVLRLGPFTLLTDPNFLHKGQWTHIGQGVVSRRLTDPAIGIAELPELDAVVLSHLHGDHFDRVASRELPRDLPVLTTPHAAKRLSRRGFRAAAPLRTWETSTLSHGAAKLTVTSLPGRHALGPAGRLLPPVMGTMLEYREAAGVLPFRVYLSGDTLVHPELRRIRERFDGIDLAVLHLGGTKVLGVLLTMDGAQGVDLMELLAPRTTVPVHYEEYGVMKSPLADFTAELSRRAPGLDVSVVARGETLPLQRFGAAVPGMPQSSLPHGLENAMTQPEYDDVERGAAEERTDAPRTPTEEEAASNSGAGQGAGLDGGGRYGDDG